VKESESTSLWAYTAPKYWPTWTGLAILRLVSLLPYPVQYLIGHVIGIIIWLLPLPQKRIIRINLALCYPELTAKQRYTIQFKNYLSMGMSMVEIAMGWWSSDKIITKLAHIEGLENLQQALENKTGVILLSPHFTTLEMGGRVLHLFTPYQVMYRHQKNALFNEIMKRARERNCDGAIHRNDIRRLLRSLKNNTAVWYAPDQHFGGDQKIYAPFFGIPAATNPATSRLAKNSKAKIVPYYQERLPGLKGYKIKLFPALDNFPGENIEQDTARVNQVLEEIIRENPAQYLWAHRRFKSSPDNTTNIYKKK